jgi:hypothetical protein
MPLQNRVTPYGELIADSARGALTGNRGILHDRQGRLGTARWRHKVWIACLIRFRGRKRALLQPGRYTHLFFLDEATALAAGHRPCFECRYRDARAFVAAWMRANLPRRRYPGIAVIDATLHAERVGRSRAKMIYQAAAESLPDGCFVELLDHPDTPWLLWQGLLHRWTPARYSATTLLPQGPVNVLTPRSIVAALAAGYRPSVHASAIAGAPERRMVGFRQDDAGDWIADLDCGHSQHMRHEPPWNERPWVTTVSGRRAHLGNCVPCLRCARSEPP